MTNHDLVIKLVTDIAKAIVDRADEVKITANGGEHCVVIELTVAASDVGKIIGKQGVTANAIRTLLQAIGGKVRHKYILEIVEPNRR